MNTAAQVFGDFVYALKCGAGFFVGAMSRANATLSAVGAGALAINAHAHGDKRNADNSQYNNIDRRTLFAPPDIQNADRKASAV